MSRKKNRDIVTTKLSDNIYMVSLAVNVSPTMKVDKRNQIISVGKKNDYFEYLLFLYSNSPSHGAIVNGKARYLSGVSIKPKEPNPAAEEWLKNANPKSSFHELIQKQDIDEVLSGNEFTLVNPNIMGQPLEFIHLDFAKCRISECYTKVLFCEDWTDTYKNPPRPYPIWCEGIAEPAIMIYKRYEPTATKLDGAYGKPEWKSATLDVDTDTEINTFFNSLVKNAFSAGTIITIFSGKIPKEKQEEIKSELLNEGTGTVNTGRTIFAFANEGGKGADIAKVGADDLDKQYQEVAKRNLQNILIGHGVSPVLFKLQTPGTLGQRNELIEAHELFLKEYVKPKQERRLKWLSNMYKLRTGQYVEFEFEQVETLGIDFTDANIAKYLSTDEVREKLGLAVSENKIPTTQEQLASALNAMSPLLATKVLETMTEDEIRSLAGLKSKNPVTIGPDGNPIIQESTQVNDNIKDLAGRQYQGLKRIVRDFDRGSLTRQQAIMMLKSGFGMTDEQASQFLNENDEDPSNDDPNAVQQADQEKYKKFLTLFEKYSHPINKNDEVLDVEYVDASKVHLAVAVTDIRNAVLDAIKTNEKTTADIIAEQFGIDPDKVNSAINWLTDKGLIGKSTYGFSPTDKGMSKPDTKTEVYTEYTYDLAPGISYASNPNRISDKLLSTSHQFCKDMVKLTEERALTFEAIDKMSNDFGDSAWDFRGGYTTKPGGGVKVWCNHNWRGTTKIRTVKI